MILTGVFKLDLIRLYKAKNREINLKSLAPKERTGSIPVFGTS
jgi:hypothetical protein